MKRYEKRVNPINGDVYMACVPDGAYVLHSDHEAAIALMRWQSWKPIETAPKDGVTEILAYDGRFGSTFIVIRPIDCPDDAACTDSGIACYPTHWQPLPAPPQQEPAE